MGGFPLNDVEHAPSTGRSPGLYTASRSEFRALRTEIKADIDHLDKRFASESAALKAELKADIQRLDDRVYALAAGLKPDIERAADQRRGA